MSECLDMLGPISREGTETSAYMYNDSEYDGDEYLMDDDSMGLSSPIEATSSGIPKTLKVLGGTSFQSKGAEPYMVYEYEQVDTIMRRMVKNVAQLLDMDVDKALMLLVHFRWNEEKVLEQYFADSESAERAAGIDLHDASATSSWFSPQPSDAAGDDAASPPATVFSFASFAAPLSERLKNAAASADDTVVCKVCYDEPPLKDCFSLGCGHVFCKECFSHFLHNQISEGPTCVSASCPEHKCPQRITEGVYLRFLRAAAADDYQRYLMRNFIEANKKYRYCPAPNCERILFSVHGQLAKMVQVSEYGGISSSAEANNICCSCGFDSCFQCGEEDHRPCDCFMIQKWNDKCLSDSETANWLLVNTKKCPQCQTRIEKNQGCNHMTCRQCRHEFCWLCMGNWRGHNSCNRFEDTEEGKVKEQSREKAKRELERYMHYYHRYQAHNMALKYAIQQRATTEKVIAALQERGQASVEVQFLREASDQVIACRRVLKYTYVLGFFMSESEEFAPCKLLFERHQEMLEENTERLHEFTEQKDVRKLDRQAVTNYARITENFRKSLLEDITDEVMRSAPSAAIPVATTNRKLNQAVKK